ncbi:MAG TPA: GrpB family protein [Lachnospiraceae bacterium]|nr:GrpB family protein [Lachnospiraceae bacterium]
MQLSTQIRNALSEKVLLLEHVGSTSVPGLCAKPIIDMVLAVSDSTDESSCVPPKERKENISLLNTSASCPP